MVVAGLILSPVSASAAEIPDNIVTSVSLVDRNDRPVSSGSNNQLLNLKLDFKLPNNKIHTGDTSTITLPDDFKFSSSTSFDVLSSDGNVVAHAVIDSATRTLKLTYTDYPQSHSDITGVIHAAVRVDTNKDSSGRDIPVTVTIGQHTVSAGTYHFEGVIGDRPDEKFAKWGYINQADPEKNVVYYRLRVNANGDTLNNVVIKDELRSAGMAYDKSSFQISHGTFRYNQTTHYQELVGGQDVTGQFPVVFTDGDKGFSIDFGNLHGDGYLVTYKVKLNHEPINNEAFNNYAIMYRDGQTEHQHGNSHYIWQSADGQANGYNYKIEITKTDEAQQPLAGAVFDVIRDRSGEVVKTVTTDAQGVASISGLLRDDYTLKETKAPSGYEIADPVKVSADELNNDTKTAHKTVVDKTASTSVKVVKKWDDADNQDGKRPENVQVQLYADDQPSGDPVTLNVENDWTYTFNDLAVNNQGAKISYTVKEVNVPEGYTSTVSGDASSGYTLTNSYTPEVTAVSGTKTWDDANNQDGMRPESVTINLLANGSVVKSTAVSEDTNWKYEFTDLPVYDAGVKIVYTVTENHVEGYSTAINGFDVTNTRTPDTTSVTVTKKWDDKNNFDKTRPSSIQVQLYANGKQTGKPVSLSADSKWTYTFDNLPVNMEGHKITYTVKEINIPQGYAAQVDDKEQGNMIITNKHIPVVPPTRPKPSEKKTTSLAKTGTDSVTVAGISLIAFCAAVGAFMLRRRFA